MSTREVKDLTYNVKVYNSYILELEEKIEKQIQNNNYERDLPTDALPEYSIDLVLEALKRQKQALIKARNSILRKLYIILIGREQQKINDARARKNNIIQNILPAVHNIKEIEHLTDVQLMEQSTIHLCKVEKQRLEELLAELS
jgi:hypothetical protein